tara:strand:+ start:7074 stop:8189 length:1116 start_codon:yes stop_codon:yes gene_type:complete
MAASQTTRLAIYTWTAGTDTFTRDQMTTSHSNIEARVAGYNQDSSRPAAAAAYQGFFHYSSTDSTAGVLSYSNGTAWFDIGSLSSSTPTSLDGSGSSGSAQSGSRSDHKHAIDNDAITNAMIADNAIQAAQLNADAVTTAKILNDNVTLAKIQNSAGFGVIGKADTGSGDFTELTASANQVLRRSGSGNLAFGTLVTANIGNDQITNALMADDAIDTAELADGAVDADRLASDAVTTVKVLDSNITHEKIENSVANSVLGRSTNSTGVVADISTSTDGEVLRLSGTTLGFGKVVTAGIDDNAITLAKMADNSVDTDEIVDDAVGHDQIDYSTAKVYSDSATGGAGFKIHIETADPTSSDGDNGDIWLKYTA